MISLEKLTILTPLQNLPRNVGDLAKLIVAKGFKKLPKVQKIAQSGHPESNRPLRMLQWPIFETHVTLRSIMSYSITTIQ